MPRVAGHPAQALAGALAGKGSTGWRQLWSLEGKFCKTNPFPLGDARSHQAPRGSVAAEDLPEGRVLGVTAGRFLQNEPISAAGWQSQPTESLRREVGSEGLPSGSGPRRRLGVSTKRTHLGRTARGTRGHVPPSEGGRIQQGAAPQREGA
jgi:hypothetical protein